MTYASESRIDAKPMLARNLLESRKHANADLACNLLLKQDVCQPTLARKAGTMPTELARTLL